MHPEPNNLFPGNAVNRAKIRAFCEIINSGIHPYQNQRVIDMLEKDHGVNGLKWRQHWILEVSKSWKKLFNRAILEGNFVSEIKSVQLMFVYTLK